MSRATHSAVRCYRITMFCDSYRMGRTSALTSMMNHLVQTVILPQRDAYSGVQRSGGPLKQLAKKQESKLDNLIAFF